MTQTKIETEPTLLTQYRIPSLPEAGYYIPNFLNEAQQDRITREIARLPEKRWTILTHRKLLSLPSQLTGTANDTLIDSSLPDFLSNYILEKFSDLQVFGGSPHGAPNHCLVNAYDPGQGIMPHTDGPAYYPATATISLNAHTVLSIYEKNEQGEQKPQPRWRILQEPGSLLITNGDMYRDTLHGIDEVTKDEELGPETIVNWDMLGDTKPYDGGSVERVGTRISLTYRDVLKVRKLGGVAKFMTKR